MCARAVSCRSHPENMIDMVHNIYHTRYQVKIKEVRPVAKDLDHQVRI